MKRFQFAVAAVLTASTTFGALPAAAQPANLDPAQVSAAARYALPLAFDGFMKRCTRTLDTSGYARNNQNELSAKFSQDAAAYWPQAKQALLQLGSEEAGDDMGAMLEMLGDDELRPFVDGIISAMLVQEIKLKDCVSIERGLEILDPLPAENVAQLVGFFFEMGVRDEVAAAGSSGQGE